MGGGCPFQRIYIYMYSFGQGDSFGGVELFGVWHLAAISVWAIIFTGAVAYQVVLKGFKSGFRSGLVRLVVGSPYLESGMCRAMCMGPHVCRSCPGMAGVLIKRVMTLWCGIY